MWNRLPDSCLHSASCLCAEQAQLAQPVLHKPHRHFLRVLREAREVVAGCRDLVGGKAVDQHGVHEHGWDAQAPREGGKQQGLHFNVFHARSSGGLQPRHGVFLCVGAHRPISTALALIKVISAQRASKHALNLAAWRRIGHTLHLACQVLIKQGGVLHVLSKHHLSENAFKLPVDSLCSNNHSTGRHTQPTTCPNAQKGNVLSASIVQKLHDLV
mmetsp:Transcript_46394/g.116839  ORF Transcript_46394/g.116839 Transcript_46394/m.116839 type:complete len:215 (+) Transcript_46394:268-912(+)